ncbi:hypothetical protein [Saccharothrix longispora]|uniref:hypothetical protein n=1 Tax=Saccharothrix longispora TaxID=33920 RepID=UPI0028FD50F1|nr:hypothetical protein [Saccharothrix longispora]MDU0293931.1 hypothetical protein [Saccharothrix longispora]
MISTDALDLSLGLRRWPALHSLLRMRDTGWRWLQPPLDDDGNPLELHGLHPWLGLPVVDAIRIRMDTDVLGVRVTSEGDLLWRQDGDLTTVVDGLLELPPPWDPRAPRLVIGSAPKDPARL